LAYNKLTFEEKQQRKEERNKLKYDKEHKIIDGLIYKWCNVDNHWVIMNDKHFYRNKKNSIDGYSSRCIECEKIKSTQWIKDNYTKHKKIHKKYRGSNKYKEWNKNNQLKMKDSIREWLIKNKDRVNQYSKNHRQKEHRITDEEWNACKFYFNHRCAYCGLPIEEHFVPRRKKLMWMDFSKDHVIWDGKDNLKNCIPACNSCNSSKKQQSLNNWYSKNNPNYTYERYYKIYQWLRFDYKKYIQKRKPKQKYERKK